MTAIKESLGKTFWQTVNLLKWSFKGLQMCLMKYWIFAFEMAFLILKVTEVKDYITEKLTEHLVL